MSWVIEVEAPGASHVQRARAVAACWEVFEREADCTQEQMDRAYLEADGTISVIKRRC